MLSYITVIHAIIVFEKINEMSVRISENARSYDRGEKEFYLHIILFIDYKNQSVKNKPLNFNHVKLFFMPFPKNKPLNHYP